MQEIVLGKAVFSDTVCATDPCYGRGTWCGEFNVRVKPGTYVGKAITGDFGSWGSRNWRLTATKENEEIKEWEFGAALGVDSATMSIYDGRYYDEMNESNSWLYNNRPRHADPHGFVVSSGLGDGSYHLFVGKNEKGENVALSVVFLFPRAFSRGVFADNESLPFEDERFIPFAGCPLEDFIEEEE